MTENSPSKNYRLINLVDVAIFLALALGIDQASKHFIDEQSLFGGVIGIFASLAIAWALLLVRGQRWRDVGLARPRSLIMVIVWGLIIAVVAYFSQQYIGEMLIDEPNNERFAALHGNLPLYLQIMAGVWITAALFEEMLYRGFMLSRLANAFGPSVGGLLLANIVQAAIFGLLHWYQGVPGIILTGLAGFVFGVFYLFTGRNLWPVILAHGLMNSYGLTMIFLNGA